MAYHFQKFNENSSTFFRNPAHKQISPTNKLKHTHNVLCRSYHSITNAIINSILTVLHIFF